MKQKRKKQEGWNHQRAIGNESNAAMINGERWGPMVIGNPKT
jgi:hypothetical protein